MEQQNEIYKQDIDINLLDKWSHHFPKITRGIYLITILLELGIFRVLLAQGLIEQGILEYVLRYIVTPIAISTVIMLAGVTIVRKGSAKYRALTYIVMITLMLCNVIYIHNVFQVAMIALCIPIFMTVVFQQKKILYIDTALCEIFVVVVTIVCKVRNFKVSRSEYYYASAIIIMVILFACALVAHMCINVLDEKNKMILMAYEQTKEAKKQAELANKSKTVFLSHMSHEIRTPINAVLGLDEMILRESSEPAIKEYAMDIRSSGKSLLGLINDVLDFSKIESGKRQLLPVEYDLSSAINDMVNIISPKAYDKGLSFQIEVEPTIPSKLYGDEICLKQITLNLLSNAVKYTDQGHVLMRITHKTIDDKKLMLQVLVEDTGKGMKQEEMDKLFTPFERLDEKANRNVEGTGLGMSIVDKLLKMMHSKLEVESEYKKGSRFYFELVQEVRNPEPIGDYQKAYKVAKLRQATYKESFTAKDAKVLVIDDNQLNIKVVSGLLKKTLIQVESALSGPEGLAKAEKTKYDVIFIDHMMPGMDGMETLEKLHENKEGINCETPTIALTANAISGARQIYREAGFTEYLTKPIDSAKLEKMLRKLLPEEKVNSNLN